MSDFFDVGSGYGSQTTEIYLKRQLVGNVESVSGRLVAALERLGYDVIEEEPAILGRRGGRGWGTWYGSADVLDYSMTVVIRLKPIGDHSTRATFDYKICHPWLSKGDKEIVSREAEAITALATMRSADKLCAACGTESMDDSRFCRRCGAPMTAEQTEVDVLRMAAETRAGHTSVVTSTILSLVSMLIAVLAIVAIAIKGSLSLKGFWGWIAFLGVVSLINFFMGWFAWGRLNSALRIKRAEQRVMPVTDAVQTLPASDTTALPPARAALSVTEGTTELLRPQQREPEAVPIKRGSVNTGAMN
ncbi:MAG TPA: zinc ribbon domain-containing protein [Pyrinomonadaceae bacterium]|nr:zinc ribbon domain-containing protein [Pyrinomonadaceae bacterium]